MKVKLTKDGNDNDSPLNQPIAPTAHRTVMVKVINAHQTLYSDQTGQFPVQSSCGNRLLMVTYGIDGNYIDAKPVLDSNQQSLITAYNNCGND